jgi:anti-sigma B factor antagonist
MKISTKVHSTRYIISLRGELDASTSILVDRAIDKALRNNITQLWVDCEGLRYISSTGLGVFMSYIKILKERNVEMKMCGMNPRVLNVFTILGLDTVIPVVNSMDEMFNQEQTNVA